MTLHPWSWGNDGAAEGVAGSGGGFAARPGSGLLTTPAPCDFPVGTEIVQLGPGEGQGAGVDSAGNVWGWGQAFLGAGKSVFGSDGVSVDATHHIAVPIQLSYPDASDAVEAWTTLNATFWRKSNGTVWCTGLNGSGEFGNGSTLGTYFAGEVQIAINAARICTSNKVLFVLDLSGGLWMSGDNTHGLKGDGTSGGTVLTLTQITALPPVLDMWQDGEHAYAWTASGLYVWGRGLRGALGLGTTANHFIPVAGPVLGTADIVQVACSVDGFAYFRSADGRLWTCGANSNGELGLGDTTDRSTPVEVTFPSRTVAALALPCTTAFNGLVILDDGTLWGAGANFNDQINLAGTHFIDTFTAFDGVLPGIVSTAALVGDNAVVALLSERPATRRFARAYIID